MNDAVANPVWPCPICEPGSKKCHVPPGTPHQRQTDLCLRKDFLTSKLSKKLCPKGGLWFLGLSSGACWEYSNEIRQEEGVGEAEVGSWKQPGQGVGNCLSSSPAGLQRKQPSAQNLSFAGSGDPKTTFILAICQALSYFISFGFTVSCFALTVPCICALPGPLQNWC